ncbi:restriction endonuclease subunit S [Rhizobium sp. 18065]|uniref:restriction endonuclease subunit S n=1 Tax=Rhizobium sp. 18065 TaxID=2681411 RepID=UPI00135B7823|nr:restriction endonuclease subunit S [Rhizobium sp. 18065]
MSHEVPSGWIETELSSRLDVNWGDTSITKAAYTDDGYLTFSASGADGRLPFFHFDSEAVVVSAIGANSGRCFFARGKWSAIKNTITVIDDGRSDSDILFAYYLLNNKDSWPVDGGAQPFIGLKKARQMRHLWPPLHEQRRIAEILSSVDEAIAVTRAVVEQTRKVKQGVLERLLTKGIGHTRFKQTQVGEIPEGWDVVELQGVASVRTGLAKNKKEIPDAVELPYLRVANVQDGYVDLSDLQTISVSRGQFERYSLRKGDVLMTEGGDYDKLGRGDVWDGSVEPCLHQNHVFAVRADQERLIPEFLATLTASRSGKAYFQSCSKRSTNLASINSTQVKQFPVRLPDLSEQSEIVRISKSFDAAISVATSRLSQQLQLKSALMSDLLTGRKRVTDALPMAAE